MSVCVCVRVCVCVQINADLIKGDTGRKEGSNWLSVGH